MRRLGRSDIIVRHSIISAIASGRADLFFIFNPFQASSALFFVGGRIELRAEGEMIASPSAAAGCRFQETTLTELTPRRIKQVPGSLRMGAEENGRCAPATTRMAGTITRIQRDPACAEGRSSRGVRRGGGGDDRFPPSRAIAPALCSACPMALTFVKVGRFPSSFRAASFFVTCASAIDSGRVSARWPCVH